MPIKPENKALYPKNWKTEIRPAILRRANNCCELCGVKNYWYSVEISRVVYSILGKCCYEYTSEN